MKSADRFWKFTDLPGSSSGSQHLLSYLAEKGELKRVRKGLYWRGVKTPLGMSPPRPEQLAAEVVGTRGVGPAGLSAANLLHLSTQVPRRALVAVPARAPESTGSVRFVSRPTRTGRASAKLAAKDVAVLETLGDWESVVEVPWGQAWSELRMLLEEDSAMAHRLADAAGTEPGAVRARLAALLSAAGHRLLSRRVPEVDPRTRQAALAALPS